MPLDRQYHQIKAYEIHRGKGIVVRLSSAETLSTIAVILRFLVRFHPNLEREHPVGGQRSLTSLPPTSREDLQLDGYLEYPHAAKA
ncbi:hypothetical protein TNCV_32481 [Trichonephila clavipes]|nr:hypothetical protein TNCV_32481 [Trichonephila clavipes]